MTIQPAPASRDTGAKLKRGQADIPLPAGGVAISTRCLTLSLLAALLAATLAAPLASAQVATIAVAATPTQRDALPGQNATFDITVSGQSLVPGEASASMSVVSLLPTGWTYSFSVDPVTFPWGGNATTRLTIHVPAGANPQNLTIQYEANASASGAAPARGNVTLAVKAPPPGQGQTQAITKPLLRIVPSTGDAGDAGTTVQGSLTLENVDPARPTMTVALSIAGVDGWRAYLPGAATRVLDYNGGAVQVPLYVDIPALAQNASKTFTVTASVEGTTFLAHWTVLGRAGEAGTPPAPDEGAEEDVPDVSSSGNQRAPLRPGPAGPNLEVLVAPLEVSIPANGEAEAIVRLANTGNTELVVSLTGAVPATWAPITFETSSITLPAGDVAEVPIKLYAPDVPPGGRASASINAQTTSGLYRGANFVLLVTPGAPRDTTNAALLETPVAPDGGVPEAASTALVVVGLAAVGGAAAFVVSRPLREKLLWGAAGLYTRLARPDVLGHEDREKLYRLVETQPGIHFHALQRDLGWNTGTLTYHLRVLEKHGFMVSRRDGLYRRFYLVGAAPRKEVFENQGPTGLRADVMEAVRNSPGISQSDLALGLGANKQTVNYHVKALERAGTIRVEKRGRDTYLYPSEPATPTSGPGFARV